MTALIEIPAERQLAILATAREWLAQARSVEDVLEFRDQIAAIAHYRKVTGQAVEACNEAAEMKLRAERKIGELLKKMDKHEGGRPPKTTGTMTATSNAAPKASGQKHATTATAPADMGDICLIPDIARLAH